MWFIAIVPLMVIISVMLNALNIGADDGNEIAHGTKKGKTMTDREKLVEILEAVEGQYNNDLPTLEQIADGLIAYGVTIPVRCKDCEDCVAGYCAAEIDGVVRLRAVKPDDFCAWGERKDND